MDCRKGLLFCLGILVPLSGCVREIRPEGAEKAGEEIAKKPETYVAFADFRAAASFAPETPAETRQVYREEAKASYLKAISINPKHVPAYLSLGRLQQGSDELAAALVTYQKALKVTEKDPLIWFELGMCQARQKLFAEATVSIQKSCELNPDNKAYQTTLAYTLARAGRWTESLTALTALVGEARAHYDLARMLQHMQQPEMARQYVVAALSRDPNLPGARELFVSMGGTPQAEGTRGVDFAQNPLALPVIQTSAEGVSRNVTVTSAEGTVGMEAIHLPPKPVINIGSSVR